MNNEKKLHTIEIRNKTPDRCMTGGSTLITIDGKPVKGVTKVSFQVEAREPAKIILELVGDINIIGQYEPYMAITTPKLLCENNEENIEQSN